MVSIRGMIIILSGLMNLVPVSVQADSLYARFSSTSFLHFKYLFSFLQIFDGIDLPPFGARCF